MITLGYALVGTGGAVFTLLAAALAVEFGGERMGQAFGLSMLFVPIGVLSPFFVAKSEEMTNSYALSMAALAALALIAAGLSLVLRERPRSLISRPG